jgi:hypothetical protein
LWEWLPATIKSRQDAAPTKKEINCLGRVVSGERYRIGIDDVNGFVTHFRNILFLALCLTVFPAEGRAEDEKILPPEVLSGAEHLLSLVGPTNGKKFEPERIAGLMDFVTRSKKEGERFSAGSANGFSSSYNEVDVRTRLVDLLQYAFNPAIPWFATSPASLRSTSWKQTEKPWAELPRLWELFGAGDSPKVIRGMETVENTPDLSTGGYYRYDLHRTLILFTSGPRRTVISISKQADVSDVGRKGYIIGNDEDWTYFYSGEPGLNVTGLGWVKSYMYDSAGISVYTEAGQDAVLARTATLKWLRAGWSNINMVQNDHIYQGLVRFARAFKEILESPRLPAVKVFENDCLKIAGLSDAAMRDKMKSYRQLLATQGEKLNGGARKHLPDAFWSESYWEGLSREEMESALVLESLKAQLGKSTR